MKPEALFFFTPSLHDAGWFERAFYAARPIRREGAQYVCEAEPGDKLHVCACGDHVFTLPVLRFIRTARDGKSYAITPLL